MWVGSMEQHEIRARDVSGRVTKNIVPYYSRTPVGHEHNHTYRLLLLLGQAYMLCKVTASVFSSLRSQCRSQNWRISGRWSRVVRLASMVTGDEGDDVYPDWGAEPNVESHWSYECSHRLNESTRWNNSAGLLLEDT